jgi:alkaline phosphatase D
MLDQRQYRSPKACMKDYEPDRPPELLNCDALFRADRTMLGSAQEQWLGRQLKGSHAHWTLLAQGTIVSHVDEQPGAGRRYSNDNWNGFPAARDRLIRTLQATPTRNPVILTGDVHAFVVGQLTVKPAQPESAALAPEFVASAISSGVRPQRLMDAWRRENPNLSLCEGDRRGYLRLKLTPKRLQVDLMAITDVRDPDSAQTLFKSLVVEAGRPDVNPA